MMRIDYILNRVVARRLSWVCLCTLLFTLTAPLQAQGTAREFQLSERVGGELSKLQPFIDAQNWNGALQFIGGLVAVAPPNSYDLAVLNDILGKLYLQKGDYAGALAPMETALRLSDTYGYLEGRGADALVDYLSKIYYSEGTSAKSPALQQQYLTKATAYIKRLIDASPTPNLDNVLFYTTLLYNRAVINAEKVDTELLKQAIQEAEKALLLSPRPRENFYLILLSSLQQLNDLKRTAEYYELMVKQYPANRTYWQQLTAIYNTLAQDAKDEREVKSYNMRSIITMERAQALGFLNSPRDNFNLVGIYFNIGQFAQATDLLYAGLKNGGIESTQKNWELLAYSYQQVNRENQAVEVLLEAVKLFPMAGQLDFQIAQIYYSLDRYDHAYRHFRMAVDKGSLDRPLAVYSFLSYLCYELGKLEEALEVIAEAMKLPGASEDNQMPRLRQAIEDALSQREAAKAQAAVRS
jgi:Flp pilus assembly protein TadD